MIKMAVNSWQADRGNLFNRISFASFVVIFLLVVAFCRLFYLQVIKYDYYKEQAQKQHFASGEIPAKRGRIYVKDEMSGGLYPLADNKNLNLVFASPVEIDDKEEAAKRLAAVIPDSDYDKILSLLKNNHTYVVLGRRLSYEIAEKIKSFDIKGVYVNTEVVRYYPEDNLAANVLGYVNFDGEGVYGLEQYFDEILRGEAGRYKLEIDPLGKQIAFGDSVLQEPQNGADIVLTINRDVQKKAEELLFETVKKFSAKGGSVIVMNPDNGEIIAMANSPTFDPNKYYQYSDYSVFVNHAVSNLYEPGSIFKVITMAAGLDSGAIEPDTEYNDAGKVVLDGHKIMNSDRKAHGWQTMTQVLEKSLNTGTSFVVSLLGKDKFFQYLTEKFKFNLRTGIEQPSEAEGRVYAPQEVNDHTYATMSFGQSISTTPIRMITAFAAVANGGELVKPHLVAEKIYQDGHKETSDSRPLERIISEEAATKLTEMMVSVVENGHGKQARVKGYRVAGKTGTAQVPKEDGSGYDPYKNIGSFIGFGPAENPRFVVLAKIDSPKGIPWAESTAAPIVGKMLDFLFKYYQIPPSVIND